MSGLFAPWRIGSLHLDGRLVKAATSETRASEDGFVTDELLAFYEPIARAGTPLVITGNLYVSYAGKATRRMCGIDSDDKLAGLRRLTALAHGGGSRIFAQLNHCGRQVANPATGTALSASSVRDPITGTRPRAMTPSEISETVAQFAAAAQRASAAGFDGVQIHMAHGYLLSEFLTPHTNRRRDIYGGSIENRGRFAREVVTAAREQVGADFPLIVRLNGHDFLRGRGGLGTCELVAVARMLEAHGVHAVEISAGHYASGFQMIRGRFDRFFSDMLEHGAGRDIPRGRRCAMRLAGKPAGIVANSLWPKEEGFNLRFAREFKRALGIPVICVGGFHSREAMDAALGRGDCDAVSVGRAMIADPLLWRHLKEERLGPACSYCNRCIARAGGEPVDCYDPQVRADRDGV